MTKFEHWCDPGHGWVKVPKQLLKQLGIADKITRYSYQRGDFAYLEEDCDASLFADTYEAVTGLKVESETMYCGYGNNVRWFETYKAEGV